MSKLNSVLVSIICIFFLEGHAAAENPNVDQTVVPEPKRDARGDLLSDYVLQDDFEKALHLGNSALEKHKFALADKQYDLAIVKATAIQSSEIRERNLISGLTGKCKVLDAQHELKKADALEQEALQLTEHYFGADNPLFANVLCSDGNRFLEHKQYKDAERLFRRELIIREKLCQNRSELGWALANLGKAFEGQGRFNEAEQLYERCLKIYFPASLDLDTRLENLGDCYQRQGRLKEAARFLKRASVVRKERLAMEQAVKMCDLANLLYAKKNYSESEKLYRQAMNIADRFASPSLNKWQVMESYANFLKKIGRVSESNELRNKAEEIMAQYTKISRQETGLIYQ